MTHPAEFGLSCDRQAQLELDRRVAEAAPLHAQEADLVVPLPGHVVARADVDLLARASGCGSTLCTASVFEMRFDAVRSRFSMFRKSVLPPMFSW